MLGVDVYEILKDDLDIYLQIGITMYQNPIFFELYTDQYQRIRVIKDVFFSDWKYRENCYITLRYFLKQRENKLFVIDMLNTNSMFYARLLTDEQLKGLNLELLSVRGELNYLNRIESGHKETYETWG